MAKRKGGAAGGEPRSGKKGRGGQPPSSKKEAVTDGWHLEQLGEDSTTLTCDPEQVTALFGAAEMQVKSGVVRVMGREVGPEAGWVGPLVADGRCGGAHQVEAVQGGGEASAQDGRGVRAKGPVVVEFRGASFQLQQAAGGAVKGMYHVPPAWQAAADAVARPAAGPPLRPPVVVVCGPKGVGKSAMARVLANALMGRAPAAGAGPGGYGYGAVAYLDTDLGQPEFTPPGLVSLHVLDGPSPLAAPPHAQQRAPARAHFVGDTSPASHPELYLEAVASLCAWYEANLSGKGVPLVVNTHGWVRGAGLDLLVDALRILGPTHVVQVRSTAQPGKNLPEGAFWVEDGGVGGGEGGRAAAAAAEGAGAGGGGECLYVDAVGAGGGGGGDAAGDGASAGGGGDATVADLALKQLSAVDSRALLWLSFARQCCQGPGAPPSLPRGTAEGGADAAVAAGGAGGGGDGAGEFSEAAEALAAQRPWVAPWGALEVVPLHRDVPAGERARALNGAVVGLGAPVMGPGPPLCLGLGVVRAVDAAAGKVYLLSPLPPETLRGVALLLLGHLQLPPQLLGSAAVASPYLSRNSLAADLSGAGAIRSRNNLLRWSAAK